jgi:hypothetical protein
MDITTTVTWDDLLSAHDDELAEYKEAYADLHELAEERFGEGALEDPATDDDLAALQQQAARYDQAVQSIQGHKHALETLRDELGSGDFEIKMLSGQETLQISKEVQTEAYHNDTPPSIIETQRNQAVADAATVDAPEGVPTDDEGSPVPSELPNVLAMALFEQAQRFNTTAATDFRAEGCGDVTPAATPPSEPSPNPTTSEPSSEPSRSDAEPTEPRGTDS